MADLGKMHAEFANKKTPPTGVVGIPKSIPYQSMPSSTSVSQTSRSVTDDSAQTVSVPIVCQSTMHMHHDVTDMTGKMTPAGRRLLVRDFVKKVLFRRLKFFIRELHGIYNQSGTTVCGLVIKHCNLSEHEATLDWWSTMRKVVISTHTDHRNNVIKTMRLRFRGTLLLTDLMRLQSDADTHSVLDGVQGRIENFKCTSGTDADNEQLLAMRKNIVNYVHVIDTYAPCIVKSSIWNNDVTMEQYCGDNAANFNNYVLSISDEAFLLIVLINYAATWMSEIAEEHRKVCPVLQKCLSCLWTISNGTYHCCMQIACATLRPNAIDGHLDTKHDIVVRARQRMCANVG
jgi:hypothetical protein